MGQPASQQVRRGQIHWVKLDPVVGSEQGKRRPAVVVSNDTANEYSPCVIIVPLTHTIPKKSYPWCVHLPEGEPFPEAGTVQGNQIRAVSKERLDGYMDADLTPQQMQQVMRAIAVAIGLIK